MPTQKPDAQYRETPRGERPSPDSLLRLIEALPLPCILFARDGAALAANPAFAREFPQFEALPERAAFEREFDPPDSDDPAQPRRFLRTRGWYQLSAQRFDEEGRQREAVFAVNAGQDIEALREHKARQEQLLSTSRMMSVGEMTTTLAHELNQPLAAIINYLNVCAQLLERGDAANPRLTQGIALARGQAEHASAVITRLREFVRSREPRREPQRLEVLIGTVMELLRLEAEQHQLKIALDVPPALPQVFVDRVMVEQVLLNLIKNAIDAMRGMPTMRREIGIGAQVDLEGMVQVRVSDRGCGLGEDGGTRLFTPLFTTKPDGLGMGLAICRSIIEYHGGRLYAEANPGGGSVFVFTLPAVENEAVIAATESRA